MLSRLQKPANIFFAILFCFSILIPVIARAEEQSSQDKEEYDFSWLDPDKKIYVVQNRKFTNSQRFEAVLSGGIGIGEPYRRRAIFEPRVIYYFNESWGLGAIGGFVSNNQNTNFTNLKSVSSVIPTVRDVKSYVGGSVMWLPFYAKFNMFNKIVYVDWHLEAGMDSVNSEIDLNTDAKGSPLVADDSHLGFHWGTGMKFFISRYVAARMDFLALYYSAPASLKGTYDSGNSTFSNYFLTLGLSYTF